MNKIDTSQPAQRLIDRFAAVGLTILPHESEGLVENGLTEQRQENMLETIKILVAAYKKKIAIQQR